MITKDENLFYLNTLYETKVTYLIGVYKSFV